MSVSNGGLPSDETATFFNTVATPFPHTDKISTTEFLTASKNVVHLIEQLGKVFAPVKYDLNGNITKLEKKYNENSVKYEYLEDMILVEKGENGMLARDALLWLKRGLHFIQAFFHLIVQDADEGKATESMSGFLEKAYELTLAKHHGWMGTQLFKVLSRFVPSRTDLFYILSLQKRHADERVLRDMRVFNSHLHQCIYHIREFYAENGLEL